MHKKLESVWREDVRQFVGLLGVELKRYRSTYESDFRGRWEVSTSAELLRAVGRADLVFSGDYHTLPAAQRLPIRLLRPFVREGRTITLALEMLHSRDQAIVDEFLAGRIGARVLRRRIAFDHRWGFDWMQYHAILDFARREGIGVIGINTEPGAVRHRLARRDRHASLILARRLVEHPGELLFVLAGDWHVARNHLPRQTAVLARSSRLRPRVVIIHQNNESLHRRFSGSEVGLTDVVRRGRNLFCVLNSAPHVKTQSHLRWAAERLSDGDDLGGEDWPLHDPASDFWDITRALADHLRLPVDLKIQVERAGDAEALLQAARGARAGTARLLGWRRDLEAGRTVFIPETATVLLGRARLNRVAEEAGRRLWRPAPAGGRATRRDNFYIQALEDGTGFFASRLINPMRKCDLVDDLVGLGQGTPRQRYEAAWAVFFTSGGRDRSILRNSHPFWRSDARTRRAVARTVGAIWGYYLYDSYTTGSMSRDWISGLFRPDFRRISPERLFLDGCREPVAGRSVSSKTTLL